MLIVHEKRLKWQQKTQEEQKCVCSGQLWNIIM